MRSYLDGVLVLEEPFAAGPRHGYGYLNIGADRMGSSDYFYTGLLDDVRVYDRALSAGEVAVLPSDASLIGRWAFDASGSQMNVVASPIASAIVAWPSGVQTHWIPAAGAFYRGVHREP
jgi:hypothetical protein